LRRRICRAGRLLAAQTPPEKRKEAIFEIVNQLNRGAALVTLQGEREQLAEFNLIAGQRAKASSAYESALTYLATGAELLTDDCWARSHELIFTLVADRGTRPRSVSQRENARRLQRPRRQ
jgi:predicted ATPase